MKYYVKVLDSEMIVSEMSELDACLKCSKLYNLITVGLTWKVSERGFDVHDNDVFISDDSLFHSPGDHYNEFN